MGGLRKRAVALSDFPIVRSLGSLDQGGEVHLPHQWREHFESVLLSVLKV